MTLLFLVIAIYALLLVTPASLVSVESRPFIALGVGMIATGVEHILHESDYELIMADWMPNKPLLIRTSVFIRIAAGVGLMFPATRQASAIACLVLYIVVLPVNFRVAFAGDQIPGFSMTYWFRWLRLLLHFGWLAWSYWCIRSSAQ